MVSQFIKNGLHLIGSDIYKNNVVFTNLLRGLLESCILIWVDAKGKNESTDPNSYLCALPPKQTRVS